MIVTKRLILREWKKEDLLPFSIMNADPRVMEFFPAPLSKKESDAAVEKIQKEMAEMGYGLWALELQENKQFIGFVGIHYVTFPAYFTPCIEIGWRLAYNSWGKGYATEAANAVIDYAFHTLHIKQLVSYTAKLNKRSMKLMKRLGMTYDGDFDHPNLAAGHPLKPHVLFRKES